MAELPKDMIYHFYSYDGITIKLDAVELIRCGECIHHEDGSKSGDIWCEVHEKRVLPNYFCADGKWRE